MQIVVYYLFLYKKIGKCIFVCSLSWPDLFDSAMGVVFLVFRELLVFLVFSD